MRPMCHRCSFFTFIALSIAFFALSSRPANAAIFKNEYVSFELADRWRCTFEQTEWICRTNEQGTSEAIIILTAKQVGPQDTLDAYQSFLKQPRKIVSRTGQPLMSTVYQVKKESINNQVWVDGFHFSSEVPNYYTRYLASIKDNIAVLVTFSAHKLYFTKYSADFFHAIRSLNVVISKSAVSGSSEYATSMTGSDINGLMPAEQSDGDVYGEAGSGELSEQTKSLLGGIILLGVVGFYLLAKKSGKKNRAGGKRR